MKKLFVIKEGGATYWWIAESAEQAREAFRRHIREDCGLDDNDSAEADWEFRECPPNEEFTSLDDEAEGGRVTMCASQWAEQAELGFLACSEW